MVRPFSYEEIDLGFSHVAATTQKTVGHGTRGVTWWGKEDAIPRHRVTMGVPNQCRGHPMAAGVPKSLNNVTSTSFNIELNVYERAQFRIWGRQRCFLPLAPSNLVAPLHGTRNNKINESQPSCSETVWMKKEIIWFSVIDLAEFHPPIVKNVVLTLFQGRCSQEDQHPWLSLFFSFYLDKSRKSLLANVGCLHAIKNVNHLLGEILVFRNAEKWCEKSC